MRLLLFCFILISSISLAQEKQYTFVFLHTRKDKPELPKEELDKLMEGHLANINRLAAEGKLVAAGPFDGGGGLFVLNTTSIDEANSWLSTDPGIQANRWRLEVLPYTGTICPLKEPYEMVSYSFIRFKSNIHKETVGDYATLLKKHEEYVKQLTANSQVVTRGSFGDQEGSIVVLNGEVQPETLENDPAVKGGTIVFELKKLWIAKGSFCE
ncbi:MAG: YciI family protein [Cyclobacteriaceae bacterium]|nr:MAG: YciI family protein [Cyclobacteriaceae bacterium]